VSHFYRRIKQPDFEIGSEEWTPTYNNVEVIENPLTPPKSV